MLIDATAGRLPKSVDVRDRTSKLILRISHPSPIDPTLHDLEAELLARLRLELLRNEFGLLRYLRKTQGKDAPPVKYSIPPYTMEA